VNDARILSVPKLKGVKMSDTVLKFDFESRWFTSQGENKVQNNYEILLEVFTDDKEYKRNEVEEELAGEIPKSSLTRLLKEAVTRGDLVKNKGYYSKNAQMLTPYSGEHLSISDKPNNSNNLQTASNDDENGSEHFFDKVGKEEF
jgi:hypothetical protein